MRLKSYFKSIVLASTIISTSGQANNMAIHTELPEGLEEVDIIIAGGGTAGCVIAARIADAHPELSVLVVEGGGNNYMSPLIIHPALYRANLAVGNANNINWQSVPESQLANRSISLATGGLLGGGSSINAGIYARAQHQDFDAWNTEGWSGDDLLPFLKKFETFYGVDDRQTHGDNGPIAASSGTYRSEVMEEDFLSAIGQSGYDIANDVHDLYTINAGSISLRYASPEDGRRQDAAHRYLHPRLNSGCHPNLNVLIGAQVSKVLINADKKATGIEFRANPRISGTSYKPVNKVSARKLVVVSAGALGTPTLLQRSGIGKADVLKNANTPLVQDLPGVGQGYQDHQAGIYTYNSNLPFDQTWESLWANVSGLISTNDDILSWNGCDAAAKIRPTDADIAALGSEFQEVWDREFSERPTKPLITLLPINGILGAPTAFPAGQSYFSICAFTAYPQSRGSIQITGPSLNDTAEFRTGFLSDETDFDAKTQIWAYKKQREVVSKMKLYASDIEGQQPIFTPGSPAAEGTGYSSEDDQIIEDFLRARVTTTWHPMGTCRMAPQEEGGVVDAALNVYNIAGLKIADMSIAPGNVAGNTMSTALLIGERAADIIIKELVA